MRWLMGDGQVVVCSGPGTVYEDRFGKADSPTCGYTYSKQGVYTVRAESLWRVLVRDGPVGHYPGFVD